jgi:hypothetical protein
MIMGKKRLLKEGDDPVVDNLMDEIDIACDDLKLKGMDLSKMKIGYGKSYTKDEREWMEEFDKVRKQLLRSGRDLSKIPITEKIAG